MPWSCPIHHLNWLNLQFPVMVCPLVPRTPHCDEVPSHTQSMSNVIQLTPTQMSLLLSIVFYFNTITILHLSLINVYFLVLGILDVFFIWFSQVSTQYTSIVVSVNNVFKLRPVVILFCSISWLLLLLYNKSYYLKITIYFRNILNTCAPMTLTINSPPSIWS